MRLRHFILRARAIWSEMDYASRRMIEIRAELPDDAREDFGPPRGAAFAH